MKFLKSLRQFVEAVANDPRIPERDKTVLVFLVAWIVSPVDLIPDWIPFIGILDDLIILSVALDYLFNHLDQDILLSHYPWDMKSYVKTKRAARMITWLTPTWLRDKIWKFKPSIYS